MTQPSPQQITQLLTAWSHGDEKALHRLIPVVYRELRFWRAEDGKDGRSVEDFRRHSDAELEFGQVMTAAGAFQDGARRIEGQLIP